MFFLVECILLLKLLNTVNSMLTLLALQLELAEVGLHLLLAAVPAHHHSLVHIISYPDKQPQ